MLEIEIYSAIEPLVAAWDELADGIGVPPWLRAGWAIAWLKAFGRGALHVFTVRRGGRLVAILPLESRNGSLSTLTNWHTPDFRLTAADDEAAEGLLAATFGTRRRRISFGFATRREAARLRAAAERRRFRVLERTLEQPPFVETDGDRVAYEQSLDTHVMSEARRRRRRLGEQGDLVFEVDEGTAGLDALLEEGFRVEASGWKAEAGTAIVSDEATRRFYTELAHWNAERGWLRLAFLRLDGRAIAFQFLIEYEGVVSQLKGGFDEEYRKFSPGILLLQDVIGWTFDGSASRYEFLGADESFKVQWARGKHERKLVQAFAPSLGGQVERVAWTYGRPVAKRVRAVVRR